MWAQCPRGSDGGRGTSPGWSQFRGRGVRPGCLLLRFWNPPGPHGRQDHGKSWKSDPEASEAKGSPVWAWREVQGGWSFEYQEEGPAAWPVAVGALIPQWAQTPASLRGHTEDVVTRGHLSGGRSPTGGPPVVEGCP